MTMTRGPEYSRDRDKVVEDLQPGDEFWRGNTYEYRVVEDPRPSSNVNLFRRGGTCVVVVVEYPDGARGTRVFPPGHVVPLILRRVT